MICYGCVHCGHDPNDDEDYCYVCADCDDFADCDEVWAWGGTGPCPDISAALSVGSE